MSDIGKGCLAAVSGRWIARSTRMKVTYLKFEPCWQFGSSFKQLHSEFEIVGDADNRDLFYDSDVARCRFFIPGYSPGLHKTRICHVSMGEVLFGALLEYRDNQEKSNRLQTVSPIEAQASYLRRRLCLEDESIWIIEIGGTAGEEEHSAACKLLSETFQRPPTLHIHLTLLSGPDAKSKPAQLSLGGLHNSFPPDLILVRHETFSYNSMEQNSLSQSLVKLNTVGWREVLVVPMAHDPDFPERACNHAICSSPETVNLVASHLRLNRDDLHKAAILDAARFFLVRSPIPSSAAREILVLHPCTASKGEAAYSMLAVRLRSWSKGLLRVRFVEDQQILHSNHTVLLTIDGSCRSVEGRGDWAGTLDSPGGSLAKIVQRLLTANEPDNNFVIKITQ